MKEKNMPDLRPVDKFVKRKLLIENNGIFYQFYRQVPKATFFTAFREEFRRVLSDVTSFSQIGVVF